MSKQTISFLFTTILIVFTLSCKKTNPVVTPFVVPNPHLTATPDTLKFSETGGKDTLTVTMNGTRWEAFSSQSWVGLSFTSSSKASEKLIVSTEENSTGSLREATLSLVMDNKTQLLVRIRQNISKITYPDYSNPIPLNSAGMGSDAKTLAAKMFAGWNLGNSLESPGSETAWGNPKTTQTLIDSIKATGINAVRIPCGWNGYIVNSATCQLSSSWLARVKEVVDYCIKNEMYVILNIHWDGGWLENHPDYASQDGVNAKQKALWEQIAVNFRDYDEHLLFAGTNEVHAATTATAENYAVQLSFNQTFVNAVRSTGGKNTFRNLVIQAYATNIDEAVNHLIIAKDGQNNRLMVEVHYYDPWEYCGLDADASWATVKNLWGAPFAQFGTIPSWGEEDYLEAQFLKMKTNFVDKGYPVILGEFGATRRSNLTGSLLQHHLDSRAYYINYVTQWAKKNGMATFIWDNGGTSNNTMAIFNRGDGSVYDKQILNAYLSGATKGIYPF